MTELKIKFVQYFLEHYKYTIASNSILANKFHSKIQNLYKKEVQNNYKNYFIDLLSHENEGVRLWAAVFSLKDNTNLSLKTLRIMQNSESIYSLHADLTLKLWDEGELDLI